MTELTAQPHHFDPFVFPQRPTELRIGPTDPSLRRGMPRVAIGHGIDEGRLRQQGQPGSANGTIQCHGCLGDDTEW